MEKLLEGEKGTERGKKLQKRRTIHGSSIQQTIPPRRSLHTAGGSLTKTPVRSYSVRKPLQVVSASKASSNSSFFSSTRKNTSNNANKMFGTKPIEPVVKSKTPVVFTTSKTHRVLPSNLRYGKTDFVEDCVSDGYQSPESLGNSGDDFSCNGEKPSMLQGLLSRKSKKLDFVTKDSKNFKTGGVKTKRDKMSSLITKSAAAAAASAVTKLSLTSPKSSVSSMVAETTVSSVAKSSLTNRSSSLKKQSLSSSEVTAPSSSFRGVKTPSAAMKSSVLSAVTTSSSSLCRKAPSSSTMKSLTVTESSSSSSMITPCKQSSIYQESSYSVPDVPEDDDFSNWMAGKEAKKDSNSSRNQDVFIDTGEKSNENKGKPERKKLKVSRRSSGSSSRKALQEARIQKLKSSLMSSPQELEIGCSISQTPSPPDAADILPSSVPEGDQIFTAPKSTPSPCETINKPKLETESQPPASTTSPQGLKSSTKTYKDWMRLFEEPFPRRSPRLSSLPSSTDKDKEYMYLMENFSPLTSQRRARGLRKKQSRGKSPCSQENSSIKENTDGQSVVQKEAKPPVSPLVLDETSPSISQTSAVEDGVRKKVESLKRTKTMKPEKNFSSKKKKLNACVNQTEEYDYLDPATSPHVSEDEMFHFPRPPAVLSSAGGPYNMVVDFALPDKVYAKLKLAKIKGNQAKKSANKACEVMPSHCEKQNPNENSVTDRDKESKCVQAGKDERSHEVDRLANSGVNHVGCKADIKETNTGITNVREVNELARKTTSKNSRRNEDDNLCCEADDDNGNLPATPKAKTDWSITSQKNTGKSNDNQSEGTLIESTDSENILSGSILQDLQVPSTKDKDSKPAVTQSLGDLHSSGCFEKKHLGNSVSSSSLAKHGPVEKKSPENQMMSVCKDEVCGLGNIADNSKNYSQKGERSPPLEECERFVGNEMKRNENGTKNEKLPNGKDCIPSSQGSSASQNPSDLKGLLILNEKMEKKSHPISNSNHASPSQEQQQEQLAGSDTLDNSENLLSIVPANLSGTVPLTSKGEMDVVQNSIKEDGQMISESQKHGDARAVLGGIGVTMICNDKQTCWEEKHNLHHVNQVTDHTTSQDLKTANELPCSHENNIEMVSAVNQTNLDMPGAHPLGDTEMGSPVNQVAESHCSVDSALHDIEMGSAVNQPNLDMTGVHPLGDLEMGSPVNQVAESHYSVDSILHDIEMGSFIIQQSQDSEFVQTANGNFDNPLSNLKAPLCCTTEDFDDNTPASIKGSLPLYSNPEECSEQINLQDGSFPLCPDTEEFSCHMVPDVPVDQNTQGFGIAESESIGDTATPYGKASVPQESSVGDNDMAQTENSALTPVLMQACLQHDNSESNAVLSISMSTYDIPGHVVNKKKDVLAVCLSHWVVVWIKMAGQEWTVLKTWTLDNTDSEMFQMVKFLPFTSHLVLLVGGKFLSANGRVFGYSETTSYDFQLDYKDEDDLVSFTSMCVLTDEEQSANSDGDIELVIAGATANEHVVTKWSLDHHCLDVKKHQELTLPDASGAVTSLLTVDGNSCLLIGSTGTHLILWNSKSCVLLKEINLSTSGLHTFDCLHAVTEMGLLFLTMCQRTATQKKCASDDSLCLLYALNPLSNNLHCLESFSIQERPVRCTSVGGQYLALGHQDGMASLVKMAAPQHFATFPVFQGAVETVSFHPSRPVMAFGGGKNGCVHVYSLS